MTTLTPRLMYTGLTSQKSSQIITCGKAVSLENSTLTLPGCEMSWKVFISKVKVDKVDRCNNTCLELQMMLPCMQSAEDDKEGEKLTMWL